MKRTGNGKKRMSERKEVKLSSNIDGRKDEEKWREDKRKRATMIIIIIKRTENVRKNKEYEKGDKMKPQQ